MLNLESRVTKEVEEGRMERVVLASPAPVWVREGRGRNEFLERSVPNHKVKKRLISCFSTAAQERKATFIPWGKDGDIWV